MTLKILLQCLHVRNSILWNAEMLVSIAPKAAAGWWRTTDRGEIHHANIMASLSVLFDVDWILANPPDLSCWWADRFNGPFIKDDRSYFAGHNNKCTASNRNSITLRSFLISSLYNAYKRNRLHKEISLLKYLWMRFWIRNKYILTNCQYTRTIILN
jgi:hypothetical protein